MNKIQLIILDTDKDYVKGLKCYFKDNDYNTFNVTTFADIESFISHVSERDIDSVILLVDEYLFSDIQDTFDGTIIILLNSIRKNFSYDVPGVFKYTTGYEISRYVLANLPDNIDCRLSGSDDGVLVTVFSPEGGSGNTLISLLLSRHLAEQKKKVLYIPLEHFSSLECYLETDEKSSISRAFYYIKENKNLPVKLSALAKKDENTGIYYYSPAINSFEVTDISQNEFDVFIKEIKNILEFEYIVIDMQSGVFREMHTFLNFSDITLVVAADSNTGLCKLRNFLKVMDINADIFHTDSLLNKSLIINKYGNEMKFENIQHEFKDIFQYILKINNFIPENSKTMNLERIYRETSSEIADISNRIFRLQY